LSDTHAHFDPTAAADQELVDGLSLDVGHLADAVIAALTADVADHPALTLVAEQARARPTITDLVIGEGMQAVVARVTGGTAAQVVLVLGAPLLQQLRATGGGATGEPEPWVARTAAAMEDWARRIGSVLADALTVEDPEQLRHLAVETPSTTLIAADLVSESGPVAAVALVAHAGEPSAGAIGGAAVGPTSGTTAARKDPMHLLGDVEMMVTAELGRTRMNVSDLLALAPGSLIELDRTAGSPIDLLVNGTLVARGEVVVVDEEYGIRLTEITGTEA
jgi:flagellar motor switch protein FliN